MDFRLARQLRGGAGGLVAEGVDFGTGDIAAEDVHEVFFDIALGAFVANSDGSGADAVGPELAG